MISMVLAISVGVFSNGSCNCVAVLSNTKNPVDKINRSGISKIGLISPNAIERVIKRGIH
jgi:hypothetical protein